MRTQFPQALRFQNPEQLHAHQAAPLVDVHAGLIPAAGGAHRRAGTVADSHRRYNGQLQQAPLAIHVSSLSEYCRYLPFVPGDRFHETLLVYQTAKLAALGTGDAMMFQLGWEKGRVQNKLGTI